MHKYIGFNARDLGEMKPLALKDNNYSQIENFMDYESYLASSYFMQFVFQFLNRVRGNVPSQSEFYSGELSHSDALVKLESLEKESVLRTSDVK